MSLDQYTDDLMMNGKCEPSFAFLIDSFLQSRIATENESNREYFDEDVNVYLSLLLNSMVSDRFHQSAARYVAGYESDLPEILDRADNSYMKYQIYRTNADFLLLQTGLFNIPSDADTADPRLLESMERGKIYYRFACSFTERLPERYRPVSGVLAKLSYGFEMYREVLSFMRGEFLNIIEQMNENELGDLCVEMDRIGETENLKEARDSLLDAYLTHKKEPTEENRLAFEKAREEVRLIDPEGDTGSPIM